jgi:hypothetical protein
MLARTVEGAEKSLLKLTASDDFEPKELIEKLSKLGFIPSRRPFFDRVQVSGCMYQPDVLEFQRRC